MKTLSAKKGEIDRKWYVVDASDLVLGRLATRIAIYLRGKHKAIFTPHVDTGDFIVVVNADKVRMTGKKFDQKVYYRHSNYPGGLRSETARSLIARRPEQVLFRAVSGMMPKNRLGRQMIKKLKVYGGPEHPHAAQQPQALSIK
ncbi:MAG: 50S ribosomal protein L13 [Nitrospiraceae bacterium]|nr:50S ribosomal protein L13 [Nitrospiraceae bacterium]